MRSGEEEGALLGSSLDTDLLRTCRRRCYVYLCSINTMGVYCAHNIVLIGHNITALLY